MELLFGRSLRAAAFCQGGRVRRLDPFHSSPPSAVPSVARRPTIEIRIADHGRRQAVSSNKGTSYKCFLDVETIVYNSDPPQDLNPTRTRTMFESATSESDIGAGHE